MLKFHVRWQQNPKASFKTAEERSNLVLLMLEWVKANMQSGLIKDFGNYVDGSGGYAIVEAAIEADLFTSLHKWMPYVVFDARQVSTVDIDQDIESRKKAASEAKEQT